MHALFPIVWLKQNQGTPARYACSITRNATALLQAFDLIELIYAF